MNRRPLHPLAAGLIFAATDMASLLGVFWMMVLARLGLGGQFSLALYSEASLTVLLFPALIALQGMYPGTLVAPPDALKRLCQGISLGFVLLAALTFLTKQADAYSRLVLVGSWAGGMVAVPLSRAAARWAMLRLVGCWGQAAALVGTLETTKDLAGRIAASPQWGLTAVAAMDLDGRVLWGQMNCPRCTVAILTTPVPDEDIEALLRGPLAAVGRVLITPDLPQIPSLWTDTADLGGTLLIDVRMKLLDPYRQHIKRLLDITITLMLLPLALPLMAAIALAVRLDSPGPVFFGHHRIGQAGQDIRIWKFRTMHPEADRLLAEALARDPALREEWQAYHKLRCDPRITRVGRWLRITSLDELPQLWNVLCGDLALVGPRPIVEAEVPKFAEAGFALYQRVRPGLTGLWQISGRSSTSYAQRVALDTYYVRNWSVWLDLYILVQTPLAMLRTEDAC